MLQVGVIKCLVNITPKYEMPRAMSSSSKSGKVTPASSPVRPPILSRLTQEGGGGGGPPEESPLLFPRIGHHISTKTIGDEMVVAKKYLHVEEVKVELCTFSSFIAFYFLLKIYFTYYDI
jgi:hypothetical protein